MYVYIYIQFHAGGMVWLSEWNTLQYSVASAFLAVIYSDYMLMSQTLLYCNGKLYKPTDLRNFAILQVCMWLVSYKINVSCVVSRAVPFTHQEIYTLYNI